MIRLSLIQSLIVLTVALGLFAPMGYGTTSHVPQMNETQAQRHFELGDAGAQTTTHTHENGEAEERVAGHTHGHSSADHSHHVEFIPADWDAFFPPASENWDSGLPAYPKPEAAFGILRPPKRSTFA
jgi:hypothetical protein